MRPTHRERGAVAAAVMLMCVAAVGLAAADDDVTEFDDVEAGSQDDVAPRGTSGFLPVPVFITEPAIGNGLGVALTYIHPRRNAEPGALAVATPASTAAATGAIQRPPDMTGVAAAYTEDDTWFVGGGHSASWLEDRVRYVGAIAWSNVNATYYLGSTPLGFNIEGALLYQDVKVRIGSSRLFLGAKLSALDADTTFKIDLGDLGMLPVGLGETTSVGLAAQASYDRRDTTFTPSRGQLVTLELWVGVDVAKGPEDEVAYIQVGHAW